MKQLELLAPAGNMEKLQMALLYGADAVYMGGKSFGLRAFSDNFTDEELKEAVAFTHEQGKKAYITINIFPHNDDLPALPDYISYVRDIGADAIIISDPGIFRIAREVAPALPIHISTQANNTNWSSVKFWEDQGVSRVVMAREISLEDISLIQSKVSVELEAFVHGAMCISYSGRCLLSNYFTQNRDANRGECAQVCRWKFAVVEEKRPDQYYPVLEDDRGTYLFNSKDLCLLPHIPQLAASGLTSFKIEGRMKSVHYVATVTRVYREALDAYLADPERFVVRDEWWQELSKISHRPYTTGFYFAKTTENDQIYTGSTNTQTHDFVGLVRSYDAERQLATVEQRNNIKVGEEIEISQPGKSNFTQIIATMTDHEGNSIQVAPHPQQLVILPVDQPVVPFAMLRRKVKESE